MNEFQKPYEYFEEKGVGGIMLVLFFMLIAIEPFLGILTTFEGIKVRRGGSGALGTVILSGAVVYMLYSILSGIMLKKVAKHAIRVTIGFLIYRFIFLVPFSIINMQLQIREIPYAVTDAMYQETYGNIIISFAISLSYILVFSAAWYVYLKKSKRVLEVYRHKGSETKAGA